MTETFKSDLLKGKKGLVVGVANKRSIAWGIAQALSNHGAQLAFTYQGERLKESVEELANTLMENEPYPTEKNLQKAYDARQVRFIDLIKHIMGMGDLLTFSDKVSAAFSEYIATHNTLTAKQIQFLQTLQTFIIENGRLEKKDLVNDPFTRLHKDGFRGLFKPSEQKEILEFTNNLLTHA